MRRDEPIPVARRDLCPYPIIVEEYDEQSYAIEEKLLIGIVAEFHAFTNALRVPAYQAPEWDDE